MVISILFGVVQTAGATQAASVVLVVSEQAALDVAAFEPVSGFSPPTTI
jgi:hypothetical protein